jgi:predicted acylesterase/phospholipase RssA
MLGIAHVGFVRVLEEAGVRFLGLGGTSAGAWER